MRQPRRHTTAILTATELQRLRAATVIALHPTLTATATQQSELGNTILQDNSLTIGHVEKFG